MKYVWYSPQKIKYTLLIYTSIFVIFKSGNHFNYANSVNSDQMPRSAAPDLGLHCLPMSVGINW